MCGDRVGDLDHEAVREVHPAEDGDRGHGLVEHGDSFQRGEGSHYTPCFLYEANL